MPGLEASSLEWVCQVVGGASAVTDVRGLNDGESPWMLRLTVGGRERSVVLRVGDPADPGPLRTEDVALRLAAGAGIAVPRLAATDLHHVPPLLLTEAVAGASTIPEYKPIARLRALGAFAASLHLVSIPADAALPHRSRPIATVDFTAQRARGPARPLLNGAEQTVRDYRPVPIEGFVHGDLWQGNALWERVVLNAVVDWECAGVGPAGVDLGSLRCDAAVCFGLDAVDDVPDGWQTAASRPADDVGYWDVVAALSTPPDMAGFDQAMAGQGRPDLTREILVGRRDAFLEAALDSMRS